MLLAVIFHMQRLVSEEVLVTSGTLTHCLKFTCTHAYSHTEDLSMPFFESGPMHLEIGCGHLNDTMQHGCSKNSYNLVDCVHLHNSALAIFLFLGSIGLL